MTTTTTEIMQAREELKALISDAIEMPAEYISEFSRDNNVVEFVVMAEVKFSALIVDGKIDTKTLREEAKYEPIEDINF